MSDPTHTGDKKPEEPSDDEKLIDELIFRQYLDEVHLLMDFVSGRSDRSLTSLAMPNPTTPGDTMTSGAIVQAISEMRYPPGADSAINARNAAILLMAKDRLSALADPARGLTIAYTTMFVDAESGRSIWSMVWRWWLRQSGSRRRAPRPHDTRIDLALRTFPGLEAHARKFRVWRDALAWFTVLWLFLTALAYWDAGLGRTALERLDQDWKVTVAELNNNPSLIHCNDSKPVGESGADLKPEEVQKQFACRKYNYLTLLGKTAGEQVNDVFHCKRMGWSRLIHVWCWQWLIPGNTEDPEQARENAQAAAAPSIDPKPDPVTAGQGGAPKPDPAAVKEPEPAAVKPGPAGQQPPEQVSRYARANAAYWQTATSILTVFTTYVLPMMFALLGTLIGAFRAILTRIGMGELAPRDLVRMKIGISTGLVAGIAVGLFLSPSSAPAQGAGGVAGQLTLTASGLGFIAGYASQSFFGYLDRVVSAVFPLNGPATVAAAAPMVIPVVAPTAARPATPPTPNAPASAPPES
jgi:hypothetical protein